jgi:hypothetical protein
LYRFQPGLELAREADDVDERSPQVVGHDVGVALDFFVRPTQIEGAFLDAFFEAEIRRFHQTACFNHSPHVLEGCPDGCADNEDDQQRGKDGNPGLQLGVRLDVAEPGVDARAGSIDEHPESGSNVIHGRSAALQRSTVARRIVATLDCEIESFSHGRKLIGNPGRQVLADRRKRIRAEQGLLELNQNLVHPRSGGVVWLEVCRVACEQIPAVPRLHVLQCVKEAGAHFA